MKNSETILSSEHIVNLSHLDDSSTIVDAGACVGEFIQDIRNTGLNCKIIAIEPDKDNVETLKKYDVKVIPKALVGVKRKKITYQGIRGRKEWGNVKNIYSNRIGAKDFYSVGTITLDELPKIDYIKLAVEGMEWEIIKNLNVDIPQISVLSHLIKGDYKKIKNHLQKLGYKTKDFPGNKLFAYKW